MTGDRHSGFGITDLAWSTINRRYQDPGVIAGWIVEQPFFGVQAITHCGTTLCLPSHRVSTHLHRGTEIMYLLTGEVTWSIGRSQVRQRAGEALIVGAGVPHGTSESAHPQFRALFAGLDLVAGGHEARQLLDELGRYGGSLPPTPAAELEPVLEGLYQVANEGLAHSAEVATKYAELLVALILERLTTDGPANSTDLILSPEVNRVLVHLRANLHRRVSVGEMSEVANLSVRQFASRFRGDMGVSPAAWHGVARLRAARLALRSPDASITSVANEYGFSSAQHFSTAFRHVFGSSPSVARPRLSVGFGSQDPMGSRFLAIPAGPTS